MSTSDDGTPMRTAEVDDPVGALAPQVARPTEVVVPAGPTEPAPEAAPDPAAEPEVGVADMVPDRPAPPDGRARRERTDADEAGSLPPAALLQQVLDETRRYHARAEQREAVIDKLHGELERLRRGERRGLLRPLLSELCRLREDVLQQSRSLPAGFGAEDTRVLLASYAESIGMMLADNGVTTFAPSPEESFEPRRHRAVGREPSADPVAVGRIAATRREGYLDVETNVPVAPAEVVIFVQTQAAPSPAPQSAAPTVEDGVL